jgi:hypothetical protein
VCTYTITVCKDREQGKKRMKGIRSKINTEVKKQTCRNEQRNVKINKYREVRK